MMQVDDLTGLGLLGLVLVELQAPDNSALQGHPQPHQQPHRSRFLPAERGGLYAYHEGISLAASNSRGLIVVTSRVPDDRKMMSAFFM